MGSTCTKSATLQPKFQLDENEMKSLETNFKPLMNNHEELKEKGVEKILENVLPKDITCQLCLHLAEISYNISSHRQSFNPHHYKYSAPITFPGLVTAVGELIKADISKVCEILIKLATNRSQDASAEEMLKFTEDMIQSYFNAIRDTPHYQIWNRGASKMHLKKLSKNLLHELFYKDKNLKDYMNVDTIPDLKFTASDIEIWYSQTSLFSLIIDKVFKLAFKLENTTDKGEDKYKDLLLPMCCDSDWTKTRSLLSLPDIVLLNHNLPIEQRTEWRYLFSSRQFGDSFAQMIGRIINKGPTILIIRDTTGCICGGYASDSWKMQPKFQGGNTCFLFILRPNIGIFPSTGMNDHYMYLNMNQQTMPNGLGMGGQLYYFGLWLDYDFGKGSCSKTCTTYSCPQLLPERDFTVDTVEVWGVGPEVKLDEEGTRSALDSVDPELKNILELAGRTAVSDDIRKADKKAAQQMSSNE